MSLNTNKNAIEVLKKMYDIKLNKELTASSRFVAATVRPGTEGNMKRTQDEGLKITKDIALATYGAVISSIHDVLTILMSDMWKEFTNPKLVHKLYDFDSDKYPIKKDILIKLSSTNRMTIAEKYDILFHPSKFIKKESLLFIDTFINSLIGKVFESPEEYFKTVGRFIVRQFCRKLLTIKDGGEVDKIKEKILKIVQASIESGIEPGVLYEIYPPLLGAGILESGATCTSYRPIKIVSKGRGATPPAFKISRYWDDPMSIDSRGAWMSMLNKNVKIIGYKSDLSGNSARMIVFDLGCVIGICNFYAKNGKGRYKDEMVEMFIKTFLDGKWSQIKRDNLPKNVKDDFIYPIRNMFYCNSDWVFIAKKKKGEELKIDIKFLVHCGCRVTPKNMIRSNSLGIVCTSCFPNRCVECERSIDESSTHYLVAKGKTYCGKCVRGSKYYIRKCFLCDRSVTETPHMKESWIFNGVLCKLCLTNRYNCNYCNKEFYGYEICTCTSSFYQSESMIHCMKCCSSHITILPEGDINPEEEQCHLEPEYLPSKREEEE